MSPDAIKLKLTIAFDGTNYAGWQVQDSGTGIQELVEKGIAELFQGEHRLRFQEWWSREMESPRPGARPSPGQPVLLQLLDIEHQAATATLRDGITEAQIVALRPAVREALRQREGLEGFAKSALEEESGAEQLRSRTLPIQTAFRAGVRDATGVELPTATLPAPPRRAGASGHPPAPVQGRSALIYVDPATRRPEVFDFVSVNERSAGYKVHLQKDRPLRGMTTLNLIYEQQDRFVLAEPMAFEFYRMAGNASCLTDFVRLAIDDQPLGYHLLVEQPNKAFLRRNQLHDGGNLYKLIWFGRGLVGQHEKKTNLDTGHSDLQELVAALEQEGSDQARWEVIRARFDVDQVINYFAVNLCLSHWDGFFNNYFTYHDLQGTGKWTLYPWDQDKTWGFHDGLQEDQIFFNMPTTFGKAGDRPPGIIGGLGALLGFAGGGPGGHVWWRPPGYFSGPLLANPVFRKHYLARVKELLQTVYTPQKWDPLFAALEERLVDEVSFRATVRGGDPKEAVERLKVNVGLLREHLVKRRKFLLSQDEIESAGSYRAAEVR